jgi:hypothetical protein
MCKPLDSLSVRLCENMTTCFEYICCPIKFFLKPLTSRFQRPYSLCFLMSYFLLIIPVILLLIILIQSSSFINELDRFSTLFYLTFFNLLINYILVFHIYHVYGLHKLEYTTHAFTVRTFMAYTMRYLFVETKLGYIGVYFLAQVILYICSLNYILNDGNLNSDNFDLPILVTFTFYAVISGLVFTLGHLVVYIVLFMVLLCKVNNSCICGIISGYRYNLTAKFQDKYLDCFKLFGIYDIERGGIELNIINNI